MFSTSWSGVSLISQGCVGARRTGTLPVPTVILLLRLAGDRSPEDLLAGWEGGIRSVVAQAVRWDSHHAKRRWRL